MKIRIEGRIVVQLQRTVCRLSLAARDKIVGNRLGGTRQVFELQDSSTIKVHKFWDDLLTGSHNYSTVRNRATSLRSQPGHNRNALTELSDTTVRNWAEVEGFELAKEKVYRNGQFTGSTDEDHGAVLPDGYATEAKSVAERRAVLAGYRLADMIKQLVN